MKKILKFVAFSAILLMLAGSFFSCGDKEKPLDSFLTVDETPMIIETAEAGVYSIVVNSNATWTAIVENADWCTLTNSNGSGDAVITVNVAENTLYIARSATIKITSGSLTKSIVINQNAAEEPEEEPFLIVDETPITATAEAETYSIAVNSNKEWIATVNNANIYTWCTLTNASGTNDGAIIVNVAENTLYTTRRAIITVTSENLVKSVVVTQNGVEDSEYPPILLETKWKLVGIVDVQTSDLTVFEPQNCNGCFTIEIGAYGQSGLVSGVGTVNQLAGFCDIDYRTNYIKIRIWTATFVGGDLFYEELFIETLNKVDYFSLDNTAPRTLYLYYNDGKNYLKFKEIGG